MLFEVRLGNKKGNDRFSLLYKMRTSRMAQKYFKHVNQFLSRHSKIDQKNSYWNFNVTPSKKASLVGELQAHLDFLTIEPRLGMHYHLDLSIDQTLLNEIHSKFELNLHKIQSGEIIHREGARIDETLCQVNLLVHKLENVHRLQTRTELGQHESVCCSFGFQFEKDEMLELEPEDYDEFALDRKFGSLSCGYNTTGKNLIHAFIDKDLQLVKEGKIRPQKTFSTEAYAWFGPEVRQSEFLPRLHRWWDENHLLEYGYQKDDKMNSLGMLMLAELIEPSEFKGKSHWEKLCFLDHFDGILEIAFT